MHFSAMRIAKLVFGMATIAALSSCALFATHMGAPIVMTAQQLDVATIQSIFVSSARKRLPDGSIDPEAPADRARQATFLTYDVSVPRNTPPGKLIYARGNVADPAKEFAVTDWAKLSNRDAFIRSISANVNAQAANNREVMVYLAGFNTPFSQGLYRLAQMDKDFAMPATKVMFDWPTGGNPLLYLQDVDSQLVARDALTQTLQDLARTDATGIILVGYSSGAQLAMEALRQLKLIGDTRTINRFSGVILISPDMDVDLFRSTADRFAQLPQPFFVFASRNDDNVMGLLSPLWGDKERLAHVEDFEALTDYNITFVDPGASGDNGFMNHHAVAASPTFISLAKDLGAPGLIQFAQAAEGGQVPGANISHRGQITAVVLPGDYN